MALDTAQSISAIGERARSRIRTVGLTEGGATEKRLAIPVPTWQHRLPHAVIQRAGMRAHSCAHASSRRGGRSLRQEGCSACAPVPCPRTGLCSVSTLRRSKATYSDTSSRSNVQFWWCVCVRVSHAVRCTRRRCSCAVPLPHSPPKARRAQRTTHTLTRTLPSGLHRYTQRHTHTQFASLI